MYTNDRATQILISILKSYKINKIIASPGTTNMFFVGSIQDDDFFHIYSAPDERSAAYMACGLSAESGEPVVITCTGATASRNYMSGLTEAYYRKLPILSVTGTEGDMYIGNLKPQVIDRTCPPNDVVRHSVSVSRITDEKQEWQVRLDINKAISELFRGGGGPVNISLQTGAAPFKTISLPSCKVIRRIYDDFVHAPQIPDGRVAVFCSSHKSFKSHEEFLLDEFCKCHNAVVFCDHTSSYNGAFRIDSAILACQDNKRTDLLSPDLLIHIGEISGEYYTQNNLQPKEVWRVSADGEMRDLFKKLSFAFEMRESDFFKHYSNKIKTNTDYFEECEYARKELLSKIPDLPFGSIWIAQQLHHQIPCGASIHFGILNSLRSWNFFTIDRSISTSCNVGGFGIDGPLSTCLGASLSDPNKLYYTILGDLAFFYDMNCLGNRHVNNNIRILLINNGHGTEFSNYDHPASQFFGENVDRFIAAGGHYGRKSEQLVKHYAEDLGFTYMSAYNKKEFLKNYKAFVSAKMAEKPIIFEIFTNPEDESDALFKVRNINQSGKTLLKRAKGIMKRIVE